MKSNKDKILIVAEIGNTHEGSLNLAKCFIRAAADCGVDAVKFQLHIFAAESLPDAPNPPYFKNETRQAYFDRTGFTVEQWKELKNLAEHECCVEFFASPFSLEAVDILEKISVERYKIASGEVSNHPLLEEIAKTGKNVILSSGMSTWNELDEAVAVLKENGCKDLVLLQCTSEYPCPPDQAGLNILQEMKDRYQLHVGLSDHTLGSAIPIAAVCMGATIIEKHFTLSKLMYGSDAKFSTTPDEMKALVDNIRMVESALSSKVDKDEKANHLAQMKNTFEKSIVSACDISIGTLIEEKHLAFKKPGDGIPARMFKKLIGQYALKDLPCNTKLEWRMFKENEQNV